MRSSTLPTTPSQGQGMRPTELHCCCACPVRIMSPLVGQPMSAHAVVKLGCQAIAWAVKPDAIMHTFLSSQCLCLACLPHCIAAVQSLSNHVISDNIAQVCTSPKLRCHSCQPSLVRRNHACFSVKPMPVHRMPACLLDRLQHCSFAIALAQPLTSHLPRQVLDSRPGATIAAIAGQNAFTGSDVWSCGYVGGGKKQTRRGSCWRCAMMCKQPWPAATLKRIAAGSRCIRTAPATACSIMQPWGETSLEGALLTCCLAINHR